MKLSESEVRHYISLTDRIRERAREVSGNRYATARISGSGEWVYLYVWDGDSHSVHGTYERSVGGLPLYSLWDDNWRERQAEEEAQQERQSKLAQLEKLRNELGL